MVTLRSARPEDAEALARLHHQSWTETYQGLLPEDEIRRYDLQFRQAQWARILEPSADRRVIMAPDSGFAIMGRQREGGLAVDYPEELYAIYLVKAAQGLGIGRRLLCAVRSTSAFSVWVVAGNHRARSFYTAQGGVELCRRVERIGSADIEEIALGFSGLQAQRGRGSA